ncbi:hypothetical protein B0H16DRAFT_1744743 [Mycena metata]|uniref:Uncharacterized protein n=1 Tax=Mycena metata TaxID=1033252 RepID=A0AAD7MDD5_9AGAR|nr:hypothetical protein B0H16DRAFT_1744743 [Mycena metata]
MSSSTPSSSAPPPWRRGAFRPFKATSRSLSCKSEGLAFLIMAVEAATAAGEFAPFPYIKGACGTFVTLPKAVENIRRNQEDLKELCEKIKEIVDILQVQISAGGATIAVRLKDVCEEFERFLQEMLVAVARMQAETEGFRGQIKGFIKSSSISAQIAGDNESPWPNNNNNNNNHNHHHPRCVVLVPAASSFGPSNAVDSPPAQDCL